jgi:hypothetical protein
LRPFLSNVVHLLKPSVSLKMPDRARRNSW